MDRAGGTPAADHPVARDDCFLAAGPCPGLGAKDALARADRPVRALYFSDHGQEVGHHRDFAGHSEQDDSGYTVPLWIWSNALARPLESRHLNSPIRLDSLEQALQHLMGVRSRWYDPEQDFLSTQFKAAAIAGVPSK